MMVTFRFRHSLPCYPSSRSDSSSALPWLVTASNHPNCRLPLWGQSLHCTKSQHHCRGWKFPCSSQIPIYVSRVESGINMETSNPNISNKLPAAALDLQDAENWVPNYWPVIKKIQMNVKIPPNVILDIEVALQWRHWSLSQGTVDNGNIVLESCYITLVNILSGL